MNIYFKKGFSAVEILLITGILGVATATVFNLVNPTGIQKNTRDVRRITDLRTLETVMAQYLADGGEPFCTDSCTSVSAGSVEIQPCDNNWTGVNLCRYINSIPVDPNNDKIAPVITSSGNGVTSPVQSVNTKLYYYLRTSTEGYKIGAFQESPSHISRTANDGGLYPWLAEVGFNIHDVDEFAFTDVDNTEITSAPLPTIHPTVNPTDGPPIPVSTITVPTATPPAPICPLRVDGDVNCDGDVDLSDFEIWRRELMNELSTKQSDLNLDLEVDLLDFELWRRGFLQFNKI